jgi:hypothetical protein
MEAQQRERSRDLESARIFQNRTAPPGWARICTRVVARVRLHVLVSMYTCTQLTAYI